MLFGMGSLWLNYIAYIAKSKKRNVKKTEPKCTHVDIWMCCFEALGILELPAESPTEPPSLSSVMHNVIVFFGFYNGTKKNPMHSVWNENEGNMLNHIMKGQLLCSKQAYK